MPGKKKRANVAERVKEHGKELKLAFVTQISTLVTVAFGLVAALAWNTAIQGVFAHFFGTSTQLTAMISYAVVVTLIAVVVTFYVSRLAANLKK